MIDAAATMDARPDGITAVAIGDLVAMRAYAGKPVHDHVRARASLVGGHASTLRGRGMDYAESRIYQPGDDARNIDWRRTARSGKWHTKLYESERERGVLLLIDTHASMRFGTRVRFKSVAAARAAAWLAWTCVRGGDRVGALAFGAVRAAVDPHGGTRGALAVLGAIAHWDTLARGADAGDEPLSLALARAQRLVTPGSRVWLLSDGWCTDAGAAAALARIARHADARVVIVSDALEREPPAATACAFETRTGRSVVELSRATPRAQFRERLARGRNLLANACREANLTWIALAGNDDPRRVLAPGWQRGRARR